MAQVELGLHNTRVYFVMCSQFTDLNLIPLCFWAMQNQNPCWWPSFPFPIGSRSIACICLDQMPCVLLPKASAIIKGGLQLHISSWSKFEAKPYLKGSVGSHPQFLTQQLIMSIWNAQIDAALRGRLTQSSYLCGQAVRVTILVLPPAQYAWYPEPLTWPNCNYGNSCEANSVS